MNYSGTRPRGDEERTGFLLREEGSKINSNEEIPNHDSDENELVTFCLDELEGKQEGEKTVVGVTGLKEQGLGQEVPLELIESDDDEPEYVVDDTEIGAENHFTFQETRFHDPDYEVDDDPDLGELVRKRAQHWGLLEKAIEEAGPIHTVDDNKLCWLEPGDEIDDDGIWCHASSGSDEESEEVREVKVVNRYVKPGDKEEPIFLLHMVFLNRDEFKLAVKHHGTVGQRKIRIHRSNSKRCTVRCDSSPTCTWTVSINYRPQTDSWEITRVQLRHTCVPTFNHGCTTADYLSEFYKDDIQIMPEIKPHQLVDKVRKDFNINISRHKAFRAKRKAMQEILLDVKEQYKQLRGYCNELLATNPGSTAFIQTERTSSSTVELFHRMYVCLAACKRGFIEGCRRLIGVDGCHLKGPHKGILLTAIGIDANDQIFPVAYAVVEMENTSSWTWFLTALKIDLNIHNSSAWTVLSDKQTGLEAAIPAVFPLAEHRRCTWHMYNNFKRAGHTSMELKQLLWAAAKCTTKKQFINKLKDIRDISPAAYEWLVARTDPNDWSRAWFKHEVKCDILVNNIVECFNNVIRDARTKPIFTMFEALRFYVMDRMQKKRNFIEKMQGELGPKVQKKLDKNAEESSMFKVTHSGELWYQVQSLRYHGKYRVNLLNRTCGCKRWQLTGIPCPHAICAISLTKEEPVKFVHECYLKDAYKKAYKYTIYPINGPELWDYGPTSDLLAPKILRMPGRPPLNKRRKDALEKKEAKEKKAKQTAEVEIAGRPSKLKYACSKCKNTGHNISRCPLLAARTSQKKPKPSSKKHIQPDYAPSQNNDGNEGSSNKVQKKTQSEAASSFKGKGKDKKRYSCTLCRSDTHYRTTCSSSIAGMFRPPVDDREMQGDT